jgi:pimeloyl-ACP methyl ester carboxylesterase
MSTPPFVALPTGVRRIDVPLTMGALATLQVAAEDPAGTLILVPGFTGSKEDFLPILAPIATAGWNAVALDLRGQFESPGPNDVAAYSDVELAVDVIELADFLTVDGSVHLVGHSLGGLVVRRAVIGAGASFASATLLCSGPGRLPTRKRDELTPLIEALNKVPLSVIWDQKEQVDRANGWAPPNSEVYDLVRRRFLANNPFCLLAMAQLLCDAEDLVDQLRKSADESGIRLLVAHGAGDDAWPLADQRAMSEKLGASYEIIPDAKHSPAVEQPELTAALLTGFASRF